MTPERMRVKLAEWTGWKKSWYRCSDPDCDDCAGAIGGHEVPPPNYPNDLNAVHELMQKLDSPEQRVRFLNTLRSVVGRRMPKNKAGAALVSDFDLLSASAAECCEALCKTLNLWEEE